WLFVHWWLRRSAAKQGTRDRTTDTTRKVEYGRRQFPDSGHDLPSTRSCAACYAGQGLDPKMLRKLLKRVNAPAGPGEVSSSSGPCSVAELPPNVFVVPGMNVPPSCQTHCPPLVLVE